MHRSRVIHPYTRATGALVGLWLLGGFVAHCGQDASNTTSAGTGGNSGSGGSTASGGSGGSTGAGGSGGTSGGNTGGSSAGGSGGPSDSGSGGTTDDSGTPPVDGGGSMTPDASEAGSAKNTCPAKVTGYRLTGFSVQDFCDAYEKYCKYDPPGTMTAYCTKIVGPLFRDRTDCETQYNMASDLGKACRAGQLCQNAPRGLIVNACSHASGYCDPACGK
jgi:hypothetical protein